MRLDGQGEPEVVYTAHDGETVHDPSIITIDGQTVIFAIVRQNDISSFSRLVDGTFEPFQLSLCDDTADGCWAWTHPKRGSSRAAYGARPPDVQGAIQHRRCSGTRGLGASHNLQQV